MVIDTDFGGAISFRESDLEGAGRKKKSDSDHDDDEDNMGI